MEQNKDYEKRLTTNGGVVQCCRNKNAGKPYSRMKEKFTCSLMRGKRKEGIAPLTYSTYYSVCFCGSCARMIAANMMTHPRISLVLSCCLRMIHPARTEMQDSRLSIRDATVGFMFF